MVIIKRIVYYSIIIWNIPAIIHASNDIEQRKKAYEDVNKKLDIQKKELERLKKKFTGTAFSNYITFGKKQTPEKTTKTVAELEQLSKEIQQTYANQKLLAQAQYDLQRGIKTEEVQKSLEKNKNKMDIKLPSKKTLEKDLQKKNSADFIESYLPRTTPTFFERIKNKYHNFVARMRASEEKARLHGEQVPYRTGLRRLIPSWIPQWKSAETKTQQAQYRGELQQRGLLWGN